jgi:hypothetical protein
VGNHSVKKFKSQTPAHHRHHPISPGIRAININERTAAAAAAAASYYFQLFQLQQWSETTTNSKGKQRN